MLELYQTPLDILYFVLTIVVALLGLFLILALFHLIRILSNIRTVSEKAKDTVDLVNHYLWQPIKILMTIIERGKEYAADHAKKSSKKK
jgi:ABC-type multidrug transport system fused ATPase/permease subunit